MGNPSSNIAFALIAGFIVYITVRGELPAYLCVVGIGSNCPPISQSQTSPVNSPPSSTSQPPSTNNGGNGGGGNVSTTISAPNNYNSTIDIPPGLPSSPGWELPELPPPVSTDSSITYDLGDDGGGGIQSSIDALGSGYQIGFGDNGYGDDE